MIEEPAHTLQPIEPTTPLISSISSDSSQTEAAKLRLAPPVKPTTPQPPLIDSQDVKTLDVSSNTISTAVLPDGRADSLLADHVTDQLQDDDPSTDDDAEGPQGTDPSTHDVTEGLLCAGGRPWRPTEAQVRALDYLDVRGYDTEDAEVAGSAGVCTDMMRTWARTPAYVSYLSDRAERRFRSLVPGVYQAMWRRARKGNVNAARVFLERFDPQYCAGGRTSNVGPSVVIKFAFAGAGDGTAEIETTGATVKAITPWDVRKARKAARIAELDAMGKAPTAPPAPKRTQAPTTPPGVDVGQAGRAAYAAQRAERRARLDATVADVLARRQAGADADASH